MTTELQNSEPKSKVCYRCGSFRRYYVKGLSRFKQTKLGTCIQSQKIVKSIGCCENWHNDIYRTHHSAKISLRILAEMITDLSGIRQILEEAEEESEHNDEPKV